MLENNRLDSSFIFMHLLDRMIAIVAHRCYLGDFISVQIFIILSLSKLALHDPDRHWPTLHHPHHLQKYHFLLLMLHETVFILILFCNIWKNGSIIMILSSNFPTHFIHNLGYSGIRIQLCLGRQQVGVGGYGWASQVKLLWCLVSHRNHHWVIWSGAHFGEWTYILDQFTF